MSKIKAIIFDMDGVLVDTMPVHFMANQIFFKKYDIDFTQQHWDRLLGISSVETMGIMKKENDLSYDEREAAEEKELIVKKILSSGVPIIPNAKEVLENLYSLKKYKLGLATSATKGILEFELKDKNMLNFFDKIVTCDDVKNSKPDPEVYKLVAKKLNVHESSCIVVEDSPVGVLAAKNAGMMCIAVSKTVKKERLSKADYIIDDISKVPSIISNNLK